MKTLSVDLGERSYPIYIGENLFAQEALLRNHIHGRQVVIVSNETVAPLYLKSVQAMLTGFNVETTILPDGEQFKNLGGIGAILRYQVQ